MTPGLALRVRVDGCRKSDCNDEQGVEGDVLWLLAGASRAGDAG